MMKSKPHIYIVATEKSGDELGAKLASALKAETHSDIKLSGIGGIAMQRQGLTSPVDIAPLSILGFVEALKSYPIILDRVWQSVNFIMESGADAVVLIDSWGFMVRVAKRLRKKGYHGKIIKYVAPQVWAMREGRAKILANSVDHLLTIHLFDAPFFTKYGLETTYVGNSVLDEEYDTGDALALRKTYDIDKGQPVLCVLFGSRLSEIQKLAEPFANTIAILKQNMPNLAIISPVSDSILEDVLAAAAEHSDLQDVIMLGEERKLDCFATANAALACSGTVTTQLASAGVPSIVTYKLNALTYYVAKKLYKPDHMSIVNIAAGQRLMPEFLQSECTGDKMAKALLHILQSPELQQETSKKLRQAVQKMRDGKVTKDGVQSNICAARAVLNLIS
ncbi:MAG: lipid-A-disaccharide synthase [Robiginitomaculum sp.]